MGGDEINRIVILEKSVFGDLKRCPICKINFSAINLCIVCSLKIEKEEELRRKLTKEESRELIKFLA